jgi:hypothetical protein
MRMFGMGGGVKEADAVKRDEVDRDAEVGVA